jgi:hypothetical protein
MEQGAVGGSLRNRGREWMRARDSALRLTGRRRRLASASVTQCDGRDSERDMLVQVLGALRAGESRALVGLASPTVERRHYWSTSSSRRRTAVCWVPEQPPLIRPSRVAFAGIFHLALGQAPTRYLTEWRMTLTRNCLRRRPVDAGADRFTHRAWVAVRLSRRCSAATTEFRLASGGKRR